MRRRVADDAVPPAEVVDYEAWCRSRGLAPFGHDLAPAQCSTWQDQRQQWAAAQWADWRTILVGSAINRGTNR